MHIKLTIAYAKHLLHYHPTISTQKRERKKYEAVDLIVESLQTKLIKKLQKKSWQKLEQQRLIIFTIVTLVILIAQIQINR